jgi:hypothetical protein
MRKDLLQKRERKQLQAKAAETEDKEGIHSLRK